MFRLLLTGTSIAALAAPLAAQTVIDDERTTPIVTSDLDSGQGDDLLIDEDGSIELTNGTAVTIDSDNNVENEGEITVTDANGASGIRVDGARVANIVNAGTITIDETYTPEDDDDDGDLDGPFATGSGRAGIRVDGTLTGNIEHTGEITVEGEDSYGILIDGLLDGTLIHDGETSVLGDGSVGVSTQEITGDVRLAGEIEAVGEGARGAEFLGDINGSLVIQGEISSTGYRATTAPSDTSNLDDDDLLQGGSAVSIEGDVGEGLIFAVAPSNTDNDDPDEDDDGIPDADEGDAIITSFGSAPAVSIGSANRDIEIAPGDVTGNGFGVVVDGEISGQGVYEGVDAIGMQIGGLGGVVTIDGGLLVNGKIEAVSQDASATALRFGAPSVLPQTQVIMPGLRNTGTIEAKAEGDDAETAIAISIESAVDLPILRNSGTINATTGSEDGRAVAIIDRSGSLGLIENTGTISATGAAGQSDRNVAIDLSARSSGASIMQMEVDANAESPAIIGDVLFGSGDDTFDIADGTVTGQTTFSSGIDRLLLSGDAVYSGLVEFGGQADRLELSDTSRFSGEASFAGGAGRLNIADQAVFAGRLVGAQNVDVTVTGGTLDLRGQTSLNSLDVEEDGVLVATVDGESANKTAIAVGGQASFEEGALVRVRVTDIAAAEGSHDILTADSIVGGAGIETDDMLLPLIFEGDLSATNSKITVEIERKDAEDLGLNRSGAAAFDALYEALAEDDEIADVFLGASDEEALGNLVAQTLPDHAGGAFEGINRGLRTLNRHFMDPTGPIESESGLRLISDMAYWDTSKEADETAPYDLEGYGIRGGIELLTAIGAFGLTTSYLWNDHETGVGNDISSETFEVGAHWRLDSGPFAAFARGALGWADFEGTRRFAAGTGDDAIEDIFDRDWSGDFLSLAGGISVEGGTQFLFFRPSVTFDYLDLTEDSYAEVGGRDAFELVVDERSSDELGMNFALAIGADMFGTQSRDEFWLRVEAEGGWREVIAGNLGSTTARFGDGDAFTLRPEDNDGGWFARLKTYAGDGGYLIGGEVGAEEQFGEVGFSVRATVRIGL